MDLTLPEHYRQGVYRLCGTEEGDQELTLRGEGLNQVVDMALTRGLRIAQRWMLRNGYVGWRGSSDTLEWEAEPVTGQLRAELPGDFLRAFGNQRTSALFRPDGRRWGREVSGFGEVNEGDAYYIPDHEHVWLAPKARPPGGLRLDYHRRHEPFSDSVDVLFPLEARPLIVAEAAFVAMSENWLPGSQDMEQSIALARSVGRDEAREVARTTKQARRIRPPLRFGNRW